MDDHSISGPLTLLPLPREIRDCVYAHLLEARHVRVAHKAHDGDYDRITDESDLRSTAYGYKFHTNILAVNKTIHQETKEFLYKKNCFVLISHHLSAWNRMPLLTDVPIVSTRGISRFKNHSLIVKLGLNAHGKCCLEQIIDRQCFENRAQGFILVADDLPILCRMLQWQFSFLPGRTINITKPRDGDVELVLDPGTYKQPDFRTWIEMRGTDHQPLTPALQERLLSPFHKAVGTCQHLRVTGPVSSDLIESLKQHATPRAISPSALLNALSEACELFKSSTDALAAKGEYLAASERYIVLVILVLDYLRIQKPTRKQGLDNSWSSNLYANLETFVADCAVSYAWLRLRCRLPMGKDEAETCLLQDLCMKPSYPSTSFIWMAHMTSLNKLFHPLNQNADRRLAGSGVWISILVELESWQTRVSRDPYVEHDIDLIRRCRHANTSPTIDELSFSALPFRIVRTRMPAASENRPKTIVGWLDAELWARLTAEEKRNIHDLQSTYQLEATDFGLLDKVLEQERGRPQEVSA